MRLSIPSFAAGALAATVLVAVPATALVGSTLAADPHPSTYDGTAPVLTLNPVEFVTGSSIDAAQPPASDMCSTQPWNIDVPLRLKWTGSDATSGLAGYDVWGTGPSFDGNQKVVSATTAAASPITGYNYEGDCGGGSDYDRQFWVVSKDNRGNTASSNLVSPNIHAWQENGTDPLGDPGLTVTRTGTWTSASCTCFNNGKVLYSTTAGASLSYKITTTKPGQTVAIVMEKNTNRGTANISVDGATATTVNTQASSANHRVIVWQKVLNVGTHTVKVANAGTSGHARIDVDAVLLTVGQGTSAPPEPVTP